MTREEAINKWVMPAIKNTWNEKKCGEIIEALGQERCEDAISRSHALSEFKRLYFDNDTVVRCAELVLGNEPPITPQPKTGKWIMIDKELQRYKCSECGEVIRLYKKSEIPKLEKDETLSNYPFSHCGCRMVESQESEE